MSVREEERNKNCPSRDLGLAAAAIGVGVGAALYYFFSKRPENPADEGSTTSGWEEQPHVLHEPYSNHDSSYTTVSEHSTTDTSVHDSPINNHQPNILRSISRCLFSQMDSSDSEMSGEPVLSSESELDPSSDSELDSSTESIMSTNSSSPEYSIPSFDIADLNSSYIDSDLEMNMEWDVTDSSMDVPTEERTPTMMQFGELTVRLLNPHSGWNREREWTLEECSICFEGMLKEQEVLALACTHRFHQSCILPWLEQQQTCPNCRKAS